MPPSRNAPVPANTPAGPACCRFAHLHPDLPLRVRRSPSDMTDAQWALVEPFLPVPACTGYWGGRPERYCRRAIVDAIRYLVVNGCKCRALPVDFPAWGAVYCYFRRFVRAEATIGLTIEIVKRSDDTTGFVVQPRRWVVERIFGWIRNSRRTARDYERPPEHSEAMIRWSAIILMTRQATRPGT